MRVTAIMGACLSAVLIDNAAAHPGLAAHWVKEIKARVLERQASPVNASLNSVELIGDLLTLTDDQLTPVGKDVKATILSQADGESLATYSNVPKLGTAACAADTCCVWKSVANDMVAVFKGPSGRCTNFARGAIRLGFHDAAGWSKSTGPTGGADGSIILNADEMKRPLNHGLEEIVTQTTAWYAKYKQYGISAADMIQMGANVATVVCPLGPRVKTYVGRKDSTTAAPGPLPDVNDSADDLIELFQDKTIEPNGLTALLGAHTTAQQRFVDTTRAGDPQDSTPGIWDMAYYNETINPNAPARVFKFASDVKLAADPRVQGLFTAFAEPNNGAQTPWNLLYSREYVRLSLLGVDNINNLTDCTKVLPQPQLTFTPSDKCQVKQWMGSKTNVPSIGQALLDGKLITTVPGLTGILGGLTGSIQSALCFFGLFCRPTPVATAC